MPLFRTALLALLAPGLLVLPRIAQADLFAVGSGPECTHSSLQAAFNAAAASAGTDVIKVTHSLSYANQALTLQNTDAYVLGRWQNCAATQRDAPRTVLSGNNSAPVLTISGTGQVTLDGLEVTGGNTGTNGTGGGLHIQQASNASVTLQDTMIHNNNAHHGGGISIGTGASTPADGPLLVLGPDVSVRFNNARHDGGGLYCDGARVQGNNTAIEFALNGAVENGGGVFGRHCDLELSSPGGAFGALFASNSAQTGGGMALFNSTARVFTNSTTAPLRFSNNVATLGGALAVVDGSLFTGYETRFDSNRAYQAGGAIYQFNGVPGGLNQVHLRRRRTNGLGVSCTVPECGTLSGNRALSAGDEARVAAVLRATSEGSGGVVETVFAGQEIFDNTGITLLRGNEIMTLPGTVRLVLENSLVHHNPTLGIAYNAGGADFAVIDSTLTDNALGSDSVFSMSANVTYPNKLRVRNSIIAEGVDARLSFLSPPGLDVDWLAIECGTGLQGLPNVFVRSPAFVSPALRDYRLGPESTLRDLAPQESGSYSTSRDWLGAPRNYDLIEIANGAGTQDLGAIESQVALLPYVFEDGFEALLE